MSLYDYFNSFSRYIEAERPSDKAIVLYWALLDMFNRRGWPEWAGADNQRLMLMCNTTNILTARRARETLCAAGFLEYVPGKKKGQLTQYRLLIPAQYGKKGCESVPQNVPLNAGILIKTKTKTPDVMSSSAFSKTETTTPTTEEVDAADLSAASAASLRKNVMREFLDFIPGASVETRNRMAEYCARLGAEVCRRAIETARETPDVKNKLAYLFGILRNREADGIRSGEAWDAHERERRQRNRDAPGSAPTPFASNPGPSPPPYRNQDADSLDAAISRLEARSDW